MPEDTYPDAPGHRGVSTSVEAADAIASDCGRLQRLVLAALKERGRVGYTADELATSLGLERWTVQPRTSELRHKRLIGDSGQRRLNVTGKRAIVWVAREHLEVADAAA